MEEEPQQAEKSNEQGEEDKPSPFIDLIIPEDKEKILAMLHRVADGKKGKGFALIMYAAYEKKLILNPVFAKVKAEFPNMGAKSGYLKYKKKLEDLRRGEICGKLNPNHGDFDLKKELEDVHKILK